jgi:hypothetical protein
MADLLQALTFCYALGVVKIEDSRCNFTDFCERNDKSVLQSEVFAPNVGSRIEKACKLTATAADRT